MREDILQHDRLIGIQAATFHEITSFAKAAGYKGSGTLCCCCCAKDLPGTLLIATDHDTGDMHIFCDLECVGNFFVGGTRRPHTLDEDGHI